jgi:hypothetical protein
MKEKIKEILKFIWGYDIKDKDFEDIEDLDKFSRSYFLQLKFIKDKTGRKTML